MGKAFLPDVFKKIKKERMKRDLSGLFWIKKRKV